MSLAGLVGLARLIGLLVGLVLQQAARGRREIKCFEVARAQRLEQHLELIGEGLSGIDDEKVFFAQPASAAASPIADLAQQPLAPDLQSDAFRRLGQLFDHGCESRAASQFTHLAHSPWKTPCYSLSRDYTLRAGPMIKRILVGIDTSEHSRVAQAYAFALARRLGATLVGLHVVDIVLIEGSFFHDISGSLGLEPYLDFSSKMREVLTQRGKMVLDAFAEAGKRAGVPVETMLDMGIVANQICDRAKSADLVMIGHRGVNERFSTGMLGSTAESVARKSPRQMFISPNTFR